MVIGLQHPVPVCLCCSLSRNCLVETVVLIAASLPRFCMSTYSIPARLTPSLFPPLRRSLRSSALRQVVQPTWPAA
jgi:hypothetical protein